MIVVGIGLSMDAFAVAICKGLSMKKFNVRYALIIAAFFGIFQAVMPLIGWLIGSTFEQYITSFDHWIAFGLLFLLGGKMIFDAVKEMKDPEKETEFTLAIVELFILAIATSIDALAVGITFACLGVRTISDELSGLSIWLSILIIGIVTFIISGAGVLIGNKFGEKFKPKAQVAGGLILILLGVKILFEHLGIINF